jgi:hypothetical protein
MYKMFFLGDQLKRYAKKKLLGSKAVVGMVGAFVENVACTIVEMVVIGSTSYVVKEFVSPWWWTDVLVVDVGFNVTYVLLAMQHVRAHFHTLFKKPCQKIGRKIMGLDIRNPWAFLKIKYSIMCIIMCVVLLFVHTVHDIASFSRLMCMETLLIQVSVDTWHFHKEDIQEYVTLHLEPKPRVRIIHEGEGEEEEEEKTPSTTSSTSSTSEWKGPGTPRILDAVVYEDCFSAKTK